MSLQQYIEDDITFQFSKYMNLIKTIEDRNLFSLFAYGVYNPKYELNEQQRKKLIILTILQLCQQNKIIPYQAIQQACYLNNEEQIESLLIEMIQKEIVLGTIDDENKEFKVTRCISRDIQKSDVPKLKNQVKEILYRTQELKAKLN